MAFGSTEVPPGVRQPTTTTYIRWRNRIKRHWQEQYEKAYAEDVKRAAKHDRLVKEGKIDPRSYFEKIVDRVKKEHPGEFKNLLQARVYARKKDKLGR